MKNKIIVPVISLMAFTLCFVNLYSINIIYQDLSPALVGLYTTFYYLGYLISQLPGGLLADKNGPKKLIVICVALSGLSTMALGFTDNPALGYVTRILNGLASGPIMACASKLISNTFDDLRKRTGALGLLLCSPPLGLLLANSFTPFLLSQTSNQVVLVTLGLLNFPVSVLALVLLEPVPKINEKISIMESLVIFRKSFIQVKLAFVGFLFMFVVVGFGIWGRRYYQYLGYSRSEVNQFMTVFSFCSVFSVIISGYLPIHHISYLKVIFPIMGVCFAVLSVIKQDFFIFSVLFGMIAYSPSAHFTAMAIELSPERYRASVASLQNFFIQIGAFIMPTVTSIILDTTGNYNLFWIFFALMIFIASCLLFSLRRNSF